MTLLSLSPSFSSDPSSTGPFFIYMEYLDAKKMMDKVDKVTEMRVVAQERAGNALKHLAKSEPLKTPGCGRDDCFPCRSSKPGKCEKNGVGYKIQCETCKRAGKVSLYDGETGCNCYTRGNNTKMPSG